MLAVAAGAHVADHTRAAPGGHPEQHATRALNDRARPARPDDPHNHAAPAYFARTTHHLECEKSDGSASTIWWSASPSKT